MHDAHPSRLKGSAYWTCSSCTAVFSINTDLPIEIIIQNGFKYKKENNMSHNETD